ncbi:GxxExxY protein [Belliella pelovolcani]|uniref:GxxExxY protein n=1 Tax=Belliella pelovolcani TaxID=529505 RepID=A0A1N7KHV8_9BACT|nr:GxxExxY protein [Belliella pelovolcani]SIS61165.1 GxxExxY protein [Belliella pelovolcani]
MDINEKSYNIRRACFNVHNILGPGLLESVYERALIYELELQGFSTEKQVALPVVYRNFNLGLGFRIDILVDNEIIIELKSVEMLNSVHKKQVLTYLKIAKKELGFLVNFNAKSLDKENLIRIINSKSV